MELTARGHCCHILSVKAGAGLLGEVVSKTPVLDGKGQVTLQQGLWRGRLGAACGAHSWLHPKSCVVRLYLSLCSVTPLPMHSDPSDRASLFPTST